MTHDRFHPNCPDRPICYARCSVCEETFEEDDMASIEDDFLGPEDVARGVCRFCPKPTEEE